MVEWAWGSSSPVWRGSTFSQSLMGNAVGGLWAQKSPPQMPQSPHHTRGCPEPHSLCQGLFPQHRILLSLSDLHFYGYCSWGQFETTPGKDDMLRECENSGHDGGSSPRGMGAPGHPRFCQGLPQDPGLSPRAPWQLPMLPVPDHLSVLPISPCHSQRFAQSSPFN